MSGNNSEKMKMSDVQKFFEQDIIRGDDDAECWLWAGTQRIIVNGHKYLPHQVAYRLYIGKKPPNRNILKTCKNPRCVNPKHMYLKNEEARAQNNEAYNKILVDWYISKIASLLNVPKEQVLNPELSSLL